MVWAIIYTIRDEKGKQSTFTVNIPSSFNAAQVSAFALAFAGLVDAVIKGKVVGIGINLSLNLSGDFAGDSAEALGDVEEKMYLQFVTENGFYTAMNIPTLDESLVTANSNQINTSDADVVALLQAIVVGLTVLPGDPDETVVTPSDSRGEDITALQTALEVFAASGRSRRV